MPEAIDTDGVLRLLDGHDPQLLEVLPASAFDAEHLPGALNVALPSLRRDVAGATLDVGRPVIVYCYDTECDLSARGAALLEAYGFGDVYDYRGSKTEWLGLGHAVEGSTPASVRAGALADPDVARVPADATLGDARRAQGGEGAPVVVVADADVVIGALRPDTLGGADDARVIDVLQPGPPTVRPSITAAELARSMDDEGQDHVLVTHLDGRLLGLVRRRDLDLDA
ncbi:MAG TPA: rhodanese-like domain-containing protein [Iamia sp.]|jgi:rhodanese-related sulfurtransferase|nr:rhodanese-like domain-containing protein [Iamia sp.]